MHRRKRSSHARTIAAACLATYLWVFAGLSAACGALQAGHESPAQLDGLKWVAVLHHDHQASSHHRSHHAEHEDHVLSDVPLNSTSAFKLKHPQPVPALPLAADVTALNHWAQATQALRAQQPPPGRNSAQGLVQQPVRLLI